MKRKDVILIVAIAVVAGIISVVLSKIIFVSSGNRQQQYEVVEAISTSFEQPNTAYFNTNSIDPTQTIRIGDSSNPAPFKGDDTANSD